MEGARNPITWTSGLRSQFLQAPRHSKQSQPYASAWCCFLCVQGPLRCGLSCSLGALGPPPGKGKPSAPQTHRPGELGQLS